MEDEDFVGLDEAGVCVGEGRGAPSWIGHDPWVLSTAGVGEKPFFMVRGVKARCNLSCTVNHRNTFQTVPASSQTVPFLPDRLDLTHTVY